jgi:membrane-bound lytic murein transglycosylase D
MPNTYITSYRRVSRAAAAAFSRRALKAAIVALGTGVAAGTLHAAPYVATPQTAPQAPASAPSTTVESASAKKAPASTVARGGLDAGLEHAKITYWVKQFSKFRGGFERSLGKMSKYADMITAKLDAKKAPRDLIYLAMIESDFNPTAQSRVKAVGLWQFMSATAKRFGLTVGPKVDERKDPARATDAAVTYLSKLHDRFGSWYLAAAAYNSGEGTVLRALKRVMGKSTGTDEDFFKILPALPRETQDYVPKLIAAARVGNAPHAYGLSPRRSSDDSN